MEVMSSTRIQVTDVFYHLYMEDLSELMEITSFAGYITNLYIPYILRNWNGKLRNNRPYPFKTSI